MLPASMDIQNAPRLMEALDSLLDAKKISTLTIDFSAVSSFDSAGALVLLELKRKAKQRTIPVVSTGMSKNIQGLLSLIHEDSLEKAMQASAIRKKHREFVPKVGEASIAIVTDIRFLIAFVGDACIGLFKACLSPRKVRWSDTITTMMRSGVDALPIVLLINFLIGLIMGFQASLQLRQYGANIFVADLVGLAQVRELGPLMTAIVVAGRSGSAFAAEIGTMKVSEEVDALTTMGLDTTRFLIVPKILALLLTLPTLTLFADAVGILGGMIVGVVHLDLTVTQYWGETTKVMTLFDVFSGYFKSIVFAFLIAGVGCLRGFQVKGGAEGVGMATTSAVVSGIFLIIFSDAIFTVLFSFM